MMGTEVQTEMDLHEKLFKFYNSDDVMPVSNKSISRTLYIKYR